MSAMYIVAYDGSDSARRAADFAAAQAKLAGADLHMVYILEWSPYSFLTPNELEERHRRRQEELDRANSHVLEPISKQLRADGHTVTGEVQYGSPPKLLNQIATEKQASMIFAARSGDDSLASRMLGNVSSSLVQLAEVPVTIVP